LHERGDRQVLDGRVALVKSVIVKH
jgi:hypothetical protein